MDLTTVITVIKMSRGLSYAAGLVYLVGALYAVVMGAPFDILKLTLGFFMVVFGVIAAVFTNDYYDVTIDAASTQTPVSGGSRGLVDNPGLRTTIRNAIIVLFALSLLIGLILTLIYSYPSTFFLLVIAATVLAWSYTGPPLRLVYRGYGELASMIGIGFFFPTAGYFVMRGTIDLPYVFFVIPSMIIGFAFSFFVEIPDRTVDLQGNKNTLVVQRSEHFGFLIGSVLLMCATIWYAVFELLHVFVGPPNFLIIAFFSLLPVLLGIHALVTHQKNPQKTVPLAVRSSLSILFLFIFMDAYFLYIIFT